jgi:CRISPR-associated protein (TIGR03986 family)
MTPGQYRLRVRRKDGDKSSYGKVRDRLGKDLYVHAEPGQREFIVCAATAEQLQSARVALTESEYMEVSGSTVLPEDTAANRPARQSRRSPSDYVRSQPRNHQQGIWAKRPYHFVPLPQQFTADAPIWHDGSGSRGRLSGEVRFELESLTPVLVGWERQTAGALPQYRVNQSERETLLHDLDEEEKSRARSQVVNLGPDIGLTLCSKAVLCPLRAPWGDRPVIIPADSLKGLLRHEIGALTGAPMERVGERSYSYRPNLKFPNESIGRVLEPRLARVLRTAEIQVEGCAYPVPTHVELLSFASKRDQEYFPRRDAQVAPGDAEAYRGGLGAGKRLGWKDAQKQIIHDRLRLRNVGTDVNSTEIPEQRREQYRCTLEHLFSTTHGHFSSRHPAVQNGRVESEKASNAIKDAAKRAFRTGDLMWVEWDPEKRGVVSFGWHYYYRWTYEDTVRRKGWTVERPLLRRLPEEQGDPPAKLSPVRRLFGYTEENRSDIGQLMGRVFLNSALEVVDSSERFLPPCFLKELGMPRPSAVENYIRQPDTHKRRDAATLDTYGDAADYDTPGELAGRKFYVDRQDAYTDKPWEDSTPPNRRNDRSTLAVGASAPHRRFRFTLRFRDLDPYELAAVLLAFCPDQFAGDGNDKYCSKLGYARPLGWGSVRITALEIYFLEDEGHGPTLRKEQDPVTWYQSANPTFLMRDAWLDVHQRNHPLGGPYAPPGIPIYSYHTTLRADHSMKRRYRKAGGR